MEGMDGMERMEGGSLGEGEVEGGREGEEGACYFHGRRRAQGRAGQDALRAIIERRVASEERTWHRCEHAAVPPCHDPASRQCGNLKSTTTAGHLASGEHSRSGQGTM